MYSCIYEQSLNHIYLTKGRPRYPTESTDPCSGYVTLGLISCAGVTRKETAESVLCDYYTSYVVWLLVCLEPRVVWLQLPSLSLSSYFCSLVSSQPRTAGEGGTTQLTENWTLKWATQTMLPGATYEAIYILAIYVYIYVYICDCPVWKSMISFWSHYYIWNTIFKALYH